MTALVSVIIPCRNAGTWLAAAIESCLSQTWHNLQIIVVDNGSTDHSLDVAKGYKSNGVAVLQCERKGAAAARNFGLQYADGDLIQFLDADDLLHSDKIRVQVEHLASAPPRSVTSGAWARFRHSPADAVFTPEPVWRNLAPEEFLISSWLGGGMMAPFVWLTPRSLIEQAGLWNERLIRNDDGEYFTRVVLASSGIVFCSAARGYYRSSNPATQSRRRDREARVADLEAAELCAGHLLQRISSPVALKACATFFQRVAYDLYQDAPDLAARAQRRARELGGSDLRRGGGLAFQLLSRSFGWKFSMRCQSAWQRFRQTAAVTPREPMAACEGQPDAELTAKQAFRKWLIVKLPCNEHVFNHARLELNAIWVRILQYIRPRYRKVLSQLRKQKGIKLNVGCGPFGHDGWVNLDLYAARAVTIRFDCRRRLPLANDSCRGIHCEHFFEHLDHGVERLEFLKECLRCLEDGGILRIVVPDGELFIRAYLSEGWSGFQQIAAEGDRPENDFATKMEALNHVFVQGYEHYGAYDSETLTCVLESAGFRKVTKQSFATGRFPDGCIDRPRHRPYSLYMEAEK